MIPVLQKMQNNRQIQRREEYRMKKIYSKIEYDGGNPLNEVYNAGPMLADDSLGETEQDCPMQIICGTNETEFLTYVEKMKENGFQVVFERHTDMADCFQLKGNGQLLYTYFRKDEKTVRIIEDLESVSVPEFSYGSGTGNSAEIYHYGLYYGFYMGTSTNPNIANAGMFNIIRLEDNSLIFIDGGHFKQCGDEAIHGMYRFMRKITHTSEGEPIRIAAWFITHAHRDHLAAPVKLMKMWPEVFKLERVMFNFPSWTFASGSDDIVLTRERLRALGDQVKCLKLHHGQLIALGNVNFEVIYTHEDIVDLDAPQKAAYRDYNSCSAVVKMTTGNGSIMWMADATEETQQVLLNYPDEMIKADVVQVAHHGMNDLGLLYEKMAPGYALHPNSHLNANFNYRRGILMKVVNCLKSPDYIWFGDETTGFQFEEDGGFAVIDREPLIGGEYDGSPKYG